MKFIRFLGAALFGMTLFLMGCASNGPYSFRVSDSAKDSGLYHEYDCTFSYNQCRDGDPRADYDLRYATKTTRFYRQFQQERERERQDGREY